MLLSFYINLFYLCRGCLRWNSIYFAIAGHRCLPQNIWKYKKSPKSRGSCCTSVWMAISNLCVNLLFFPFFLNHKDSLCKHNKASCVMVHRTNFPQTEVWYAATWKKLNNLRRAAIKKNSSKRIFVAFIPPSLTRGGRHPLRAGVHLGKTVFVFMRFFIP